MVEATVLAVLDEVAGGEEIEVTKHGRPVARIVPIRSPRDLRGRFAGVAASSVDDEALFSTGEVWNASPDGGRLAR